MPQTELKHSSDCSLQSPYMLSAKSASAIAIGSGITGLCEAWLTHGFDTIIKRLMTNRNGISLASWAQFKASVFPVIFKEAYNKSFSAKVRSVYPGIGYVTEFKIAERMSGFTLQSAINRPLQENCGQWYKDHFGVYGKPLIEGTAGMLVGLAQVGLAPLDSLRTKAQTNPEALKGRSTWDIIRTERLRLFNGAVPMAIRNPWGSLFMFGVPSMIYINVFDKPDSHNATISEKLIASSAGAIATAVATQPLDVILKRVQQQAKQNVSAAPDEKFVYKNALQLAKELVEKEGLRGFAKGGGLKLVIAAPKIFFAFMAKDPITAAFVSGYNGYVAESLASFHKSVSGFFSTKKPQTSSPVVDDSPSNENNSLIYGFTG